VIGVIAAHGQIMSGYWAAVTIGAVQLLVLILLAATAVVRWRRHHSGSAKDTAAGSSTWRDYPANHPVVRVRLLIEEAMIVRERLSGHIDTATYQQRMHELVSSHHSPSPRTP
jgi:hypothetical protein